VIWFGPVCSHQIHLPFRGDSVRFLRIFLSSRPAVFLEALFLIRLYSTGARPPDSGRRALLLLMLWFLARQHRQHLRFSSVDGVTDPPTKASDSPFFHRLFWLLLSKSCPFLVQLLGTIILLSFAWLCFTDPSFFDTYR